MLKDLVHDFQEIVSFKKRAFLTSASCLVAAELKQVFIFSLRQTVGLICYMHATEEVSYFHWPAHLRQIVGLISNLQLSAVKTHRHQDVLLKERVIF